MTTYAESIGSDALRADGRPVHIRLLRTDDADLLRAFNDRCSDNSLYFRFFAGGRAIADRYVDRLTRSADQGRTLVATVAGDIVAVAGYEVIDADEAEVALIVADDWQHAGIGTLLLEHLASVARHNGLQRFVAEVLVHNLGMRRAFRDLGYACAERMEDGVAKFEVGLAATAAVQESIDERDRRAEQASMRPLLAPRSVVVIGASIREDSIGNAMLRNILEGGFTGGLYVVNPNRQIVLGVDSFPSVADLPVVPDLAIICVPPRQALAAIESCGRAGIPSAAVITSGFSETGVEGAALQVQLLEAARHYGVRMLGPNCLGLVNTDPLIQLNATFADLSVRPGGLALASQSGALGIAVLSKARERGIGVAQFVSMGNKADVSGNDLLLAWHADPNVTVIALYLESLGNPRKFARICRRVTRDKPIIVIKSGRSDAGRRAGRSHTAAAAASDRVIDALFEQAGVIRVDTIQEMLNAAAVLADRRTPEGPRLAIVGNSGGPEILAADAAAAAGLSVEQLSTAVARDLRRTAPDAPSVENPIDLGPAARPDTSADVIDRLAASDEVDAVLAVFSHVAVIDDDEIVAAVVAAAERTTKPVVLCQIGRPPRPADDAGARLRPLPRFTFPEPAAKALAAAWRWSRIRSTRFGEATAPEGIDLNAARQVLREASSRGHEWLRPDEVARLLDCFGINRVAQAVVNTREDALAAAHQVGFPVVLKGGPAGAHKSALGAIRLDLRTDTEVLQAFGELMAIPGTDDVLVQPIAEAGVELIVGAVADPQFGPTVMIGAGGALAGLTNDEVFRLAPINEREAADAIDGSRTLVQLLLGWHGSEPVSRAAVATLVATVSTLIHELPEVAELDLNPVICHGRDLVAVDARVRVAAAADRPDPTVRVLRPVR